MVFLRNLKSFFLGKREQRIPEEEGTPWKLISNLCLQLAHEEIMERPSLGKKKNPYRGKKGFRWKQNEERRGKMEQNIKKGKECKRKRKEHG